MMIKKRKLQEKSWQAKKEEFDIKKAEALTRLKLRAASTLTSVGTAHIQAKSLLETETAGSIAIKSQWQAIDANNRMRSATAINVMTEEHFVRMEPERHKIHRREATVVESNIERTTAHMQAEKTALIALREKKKNNIIEKLHSEALKKADITSTRQKSVTIGGESYNNFSRATYNLTITRHAHDGIYVYIHICTHTNYCKN